MMIKGFWEKLSARGGSPPEDGQAASGGKKPIMVLAPMADVTDAPFRQLIAKYGKPDVMFTEFVSADGLLSPGRGVLMKDLIFTEDERPIVAQFFTTHPEKMKKVAELAVELGFDGIDINMGCPDKSVEKQGAGASLIKNPDHAVELIRAAQSGAGDLPISVKTRVGYDKDITEEWVGNLLGAEPAAIILHARTRKEMSKVPAHWESITRAVSVAKGSGTLIIGNGDVMNIKEAYLRAEETGADGVMIGRGIFGNPWLFSGKEDINTKEKLNVLVEHTKLFEEILGEAKNFAIMKKHYKAYANGFDGAKELRIELMEANNAADVKKIISSFLSTNK